MDQTSTGATGRRVRVAAVVVGACLLVIAAVLAVLPMTVEVGGSTASCGVPAFALRAPSESDDVGFNAVDDACAGAAFGRVFTAGLIGAAGAVVIVCSQRVGRRKRS